MIMLNLYSQFLLIIYTEGSTKNDGDVGNNNKKKSLFMFRNSLI